MYADESENTGANLFHMNQLSNGDILTKIDMDRIVFSTSSYASEMEVEQNHINIANNMVLLDAVQSAWNNQPPGF